jgi:AAHS family 4-hydroxybenzoate transporter-like MFS transporter
MNDSTATSFDLDRFFDEQRLRPIHALILVVLTLVMLIDGYDISAVGVMLPLIAHDWAVTPSSLTGVFVVQQLGLLVGVALGGQLGDRFGRRPVLIACMTAFGLCTLLIAQTKSSVQLTSLRFISALFFSSVLPNCVAYASEIAPKKYRAAFITIVFCGYTGGHFISALVLAFVVGPMGWQGAFYVGGFLPLILVPVVWLYLPESARFLASRRAPAGKIRELLMRFDPDLKVQGIQSYIVAGVRQAKARFPVSDLFRGGLLRLTILVWSGYFFAFMLNQLTSNWDTTILHDVAHLPLSHIALILTCRTAAGMVGTITSGMLMDRFGASRMLASFYLATATLLALIGFLDLGSMFALGIFTLLSFASNSGLAGLNAIAALIYPARMRVTGVAWGSGMGRVGGMIGPIFGGVLLAGMPNVTLIYMCAAIPAALTALAIFSMVWNGRTDTAGKPDTGRS